MTNDIATISNSFTPVTYTLKSGKVKTAHNEVSAAFAPAVVRKQAAHAAALKQLQNGQYKPTLAAIAALMTKGDVKTLQGFGVMPSANPTKKEVCHFLSCVQKNWVNAKGEKAAQAALIKEFLEWVDAKEKTSTLPPAQQ